LSVQEVLRKKKIDSQEKEGCDKNFYTLEAHLYIPLEKIGLMEEMNLSFSPAIIVSNDVMAQAAVRLSQSNSLLDTGFMRNDFIYDMVIGNEMWIKSQVKRNQK